MPIAKIQLPDGRIAKFEVPEGTTPEQVTEYANANIESFGGKEPQQVEEPGYIQQTIENIPASAAEFGKNIYEAVSSPMETLKAVGRAGAGFMESLHPEEIPTSMPEDKQAYEGMKQMLVDRYGSLEALAETVKNDPVGFAADLSTVLTGGGAMASRLPGVAGKVAKVTRAAGEAVSPINIAKQVATAPLKAIPKAIPKKLYGSAMKMSTTLDPKDRAARIQTGLDAGIMPSQKGLDKLRGLVDTTNKEISTLINKSVKAGDTIESHSIRQRLNQLRKFADETIDPDSMHSAIDGIEQSFKDFHGKKIPVDKAQRLKQNTYTLLRKAYGELKSGNIEAQKQIARGIKEELATKYPVLSELNVKESAFLKLNDSLERSVARIANRDVIGLGGSAKTGAGAVMAGGPGAAAGLAAAVLDQPQVKAALAIALNRAKKIGTKRASIKPLAAFQAGRIKEETNQ